MTDKILLAHGCSMTFGFDLSGKQINEENAADKKYRENHSWPSYVAKEFGYDIVNLSAPGNANDNIIRTTVNWMLTNKCDLVIIGWSGPPRKEVWSNFRNDYFLTVPELLHTNSKQEKLATSKYWELILDSNSLLASTLLQMLLLQAFLKEKKIPFLFFDAVDDYNSSILIDSTKILYNSIDKENYYNEESFMNFSFRHPGKLGQTGHPMEKCHKEWADSLIAFIKEKSIV